MRNDEFFLSGEPMTPAEDNTRDESLIPIAQDMLLVVEDNNPSPSPSPLQEPVKFNVLNLSDSEPSGTMSPRLGRQEDSDMTEELDMEASQESMEDSDS